MSYLDADHSADRVKSALGVAALMAIAGYAALVAQETVLQDRGASGLSTFDIAIAPPPPPPEPAPEPSKAEAGEASKENLRATPTPVVAPRPVMPPIPVPVTAAPVAGDGNQGSAGASDRPGPGTGAGGDGNGLGSGRSGSGTGSGGIASGPQRIEGTISNRDFRRLPAAIKIDGIVTALISVGANGRPTGCRITQPSGSAQLDTKTCQLIMDRFVYEPARDRAGNAVPSEIYRTQRYCLKGQNCTI